ncbi:copper chaperone PCu(A)C [Frateuria sp. MAH-13]|uniref:Copper chaperone PCu(A)C n=1 Tax=Frateuria flava TaxID=2821489 RepID=A0ABS4DI17_9GAMM|nr:copper chaperone PCu(A)C [Frateuria flava]MBP1472693.1 copper chaperone PCu(A)C [Frateuria flava]
MTLRSLPLLLAGLLAAGAAHAGQADHVRAANAWIRVMPASLPAGGYVTLRNEGDQPAVLDGASSAAYASVMLHESSTDTGMGRMRMVDRLTVPAHGQVALAPGGYHFMLMSAATPVQPGQTVQVTLHFADGSTLATDFLAKPANAL